MAAGVLVVHLLTVTTPFAALSAWTLLGDGYHTVAIVLPRPDREAHPEGR